MTGKTYIGQVWSLAGSKNLSTLRATSTNSFTGSNYTSATEVEFEFDSINIGPGDAIIITNTDSGGDPANYVRVAYIASDADGGYFAKARWLNTGALGATGIEAADFFGSVYEYVLVE